MTWLDLYKALNLEQQVVLICLGRRHLKTVTKQEHLLANDYEERAAEEDRKILKDIQVYVNS